MRAFRTHGSGELRREAFAALGDNVVFEAGVLVFHPERIRLGRNVYVGHYAILKGYHRNEIVIGDDVWIGQQSFLHGAGGLTIGPRVGIGPGVKVLTSRHREEGWHKPILDSGLELAPVVIGEDSDIGAGAVILPGVTIGRGVQVGAGAVVTRDLADHVVAAGVPARTLRARPERRP